MHKAQRETLAADVLALSQADATEAMVTHDDLALTRYTQNAIHQNLASGETRVRVRALVDGRTGVAATNDPSRTSLERTVARAKEMALLAPRDPSAPGLTHNTPVAAPVGAYVQATAQASPDLRAEFARTVFERSQALGLWSAGFVTTSSAGITIANTAGTVQSFDGTDAEVNVKANGPDSTGFAERYSCDVTQLNVPRVAEIATAKARDSREPVAVDPGLWTVILEPPAFGELFEYLVDHFSARAVEEGSSFLCDGLDRRYLDESVTIRDDFAHPLNPGMPFDFEGTPAQRLTLVERGVAKNIVTDSASAARLNRANTGHAQSAPSADGPQARHIVVDPGSRSLDELIAGTQRGLLVSRFWYIRTVDQRQAIVTGMTRDGTFLIENGKLTRGVRNLRFNQNIVQALQSVEFSNECARTGGYSYSMVVPAARVRDFHFTSVTDF